MKTVINVLVGLFVAVCLYEIGGLLVQVWHGKEAWKDVLEYLLLIVATNGSVLFLLIGLVYAAKFFYMRSKTGPAGTGMLCTTCGHLGSPTLKKCGSSLFNFILFLFLVIPGILYYAWRITNPIKICQKCGDAKLIPSDSPMAIQLQKQLSGSP